MVLDVNSVTVAMSSDHFTQSSNMPGTRVTFSNIVIIILQKTLVTIYGKLSETRSNGLMYELWRSLRSKRPVLGFLIRLKPPFLSDSFPEPSAANILL